MREATTRHLKKTPLHIPLPLYVRNVGRHMTAQECEGEVSDLLSDYIGMTFCVKGAGTAFLFQESSIIPMKNIASSRKRRIVKMRGLILTDLLQCLFFPVTVSRGGSP